MAAKKTAAPVAASAELALVQSLADILAATGLSEIELEQKGIRVRVSKGVTVVATAAAPSYAPQPQAAAAPVVAAAPPAPAANPNTVKSPMVGSAYLAAAPGSPDFMTVGMDVKQGQTILIIEAMKTMNQIPSPRAGKVTQIFVENGNPVEYGEPLCVIE